jgi:DNA modification methylase
MRELPDGCVDAVITSPPYNQLGSRIPKNPTGLGTVWHIPREQDKEHPVAFPDELPHRCISAATYESDMILEPFAGSGTTLVAAKKLGRHFLGFEISPEYCEIARDRLARTDAQPSLFHPKPEQLSLNGGE